MYRFDNLIHPLHYIADNRDHTQQPHNKYMPTQIKQSEKEYYPNMDLVRYVLALAVIISHINELAGFRIPFFISSYEGVGGFFALSGFLMYPNYLRHNNFWSYTRQRARRILPPYLFVVLLAALGLVCVSSLSPSDYYLSGGFWKYLTANLSFLNWLHPTLPGVFDTPEFCTSAVNGSLWTMKVEWCLYFSVPIFIYLIKHCRWLSRNRLAVITIILSICYRLAFLYLYQTTHREIFNILNRQIFGQLSYFYCGMLIYFYKDFFKKHLFKIFVTCILIAIASGYSYLGRVILTPFAISGAVMALSLFPHDLKAIRHRSNISYEMYLFHFPVVQLSVFLGIYLTGIWTEFLFVIGFTIALSLIAHHLSKRMLRPAAGNLRR